MFGQASHILNKHYCKPVTQLQYVLFYSLLNQLFLHIWPHWFTLLLLSFSHFQGLLLNFKPDVFSVLKVYSVEGMDGEPGEGVEPLAADVDGSSLPCSSQSSDCSGSADSVSTEDLELSALLSRSSSDEEEGSLRSVEAPGTPQPERDSEGKGTGSGVSKQEEAYVTMSNFYQINKSVQKQWRSETLFWVLKSGEEVRKKKTEVLKKMAGRETNLWPTVVVCRLKCGV